jgi:hypothetical protein
VLLVEAVRGPLKVSNAVVDLDMVLVVDEWQTERVWNPALGHKPMHRNMALPCPHVWFME